MTKTNCITPNDILKAMLEDDPENTPETNGVIIMPDDLQNILFKGTLAECVDQIYMANYEHVIIATFEKYLEMLNDD